jgi:zinc D-Ala-D-Ala carboxypeptidase
MDRTAPAPTSTRRALPPAAVALVVVLAVAAIACRAGSSSPTTATTVLLGRDDGDTTTVEDEAPLTAADGVLPEGASVFDDEHPGVANLDPDLLRALRRAATDAAHDGVTFEVNSGWRSPEHQDRLLREAVAEHGSEAEAARWVATSDTSAHVTGDAVAIGPRRATDWLAQHGAAYGLCRTYDNEPWHHELHPDAVERGCPPPFPDPTHDPRMHP